MNAAATDQPDVESGVLDDLHRSHDRVVDPQVGVPKTPPPTRVNETIFGSG
jgi:hypothetical protein